MANANCIDTPAHPAGQSAQPPEGGQPLRPTPDAETLRDQLAWAERVVSESTEDIRAVAFGALEMLRHGSHIAHVYTLLTVIAQKADDLSAYVQEIAASCGLEVKDDVEAWNNSALAQRRWVLSEKAQGVSHG